MDVFKVLEEKIATLVGVVQDLKSKNEALKAENEKAKKECEALQYERDELLKDNAQLLSKFDAMESSLHVGNERMEETKIVVDDLIRSIDALVGNEHQQ